MPRSQGEQKMQDTWTKGELLVAFVIAKGWTLMRCVHAGRQLQQHCQVSLVGPKCVQQHTQVSAGTLLLLA